jgi:hypothetical protein
VAVPPQKFAERSRAPSFGSFRAGARYLGRSYLALPYRVLRSSANALSTKYHFSTRAFRDNLLSVLTLETCVQTARADRSVFTQLSGHNNQGTT